MTIDNLYKKNLDLSTVFGLCWIILDNEMVNRGGRYPNLWEKKDY